ncbi:uncharacterized protein LOC135594507 [Musa acuminata AAA Group]|uniref:uncharacterized protein LOC135594507 n=1 Tax=Musa acuminata AAA Group TaxID=214697 RepID=UPI0031CDB1AB
MASRLRLFSAAALLLVAVLTVSADDAHDVLQAFGLPKGLLPDSVSSFSLAENGEFVVELRAPCYVQFTDLVHYGKTIRGQIRYGIISDISGIQIKKFFAWLSISDIVAHPADGTIEFQVGFLSELRPATLFESVPHCRAIASPRGVFSPEELLPLPVSEVRSLCLLISPLL